MGTAIKHPMQGRVEPSFVIFDIRALWRSGLSVRVPDVKNYKWWLNPAWHRMLYSCTHVAPLGVKGLAQFTVAPPSAMCDVIFLTKKLKTRTVPCFVRVKIFAECAVRTRPF